MFSLGDNQPDGTIFYRKTVTESEVGTGLGYAQHRYPGRAGLQRFIPWSQMAMPQTEDNENMALAVVRDVAF